LEEFSSNIPSFANAEELWENYRIFKERWWSATLQSPEILVAAYIFVAFGINVFDLVDCRGSL
jgi:hypothetical protein